jgi:serine/threonine protein kinase
MARLALAVDALHRHGIVHGRISLDHILAELQNGIIVRSVLTGLTHCQPFHPDWAEADIRALSECFRTMVSPEHHTPEFIDLVNSMNPTSPEINPISLDCVMGHPLFTAFIEEGKIVPILKALGDEPKFIGRLPVTNEKGIVWHFGRCLGEPGPYVNVVKGWNEGEGENHLYALKIASNCLRELTQYRTSLRWEGKLDGGFDKFVLPLTRFALCRQVGGVYEKLDATVVVYNLYTNDLREWVQNKGIPDLGMLLELMRQMATCVIVLHCQARIHNGIHLDNFLVEELPAGGIRIRLGGFSRLQAWDERHSREPFSFPVREGEVPAYMAPEIMDPEIINPICSSFATDMWALGCCFQALLQTYKGDNVPEYLTEIVNQLLERNPKKRMDIGRLYASQLMCSRFGPDIQQADMIER